MRANELMPGRRVLALRRWRNPMPLQDIPHGLVAYTIAQMRERSSDAIIAPRAILLGHAHHQCLQLLADLWSPKSLALLGAVKLLSHQGAVPGQDRMGCDKGRNLFQRPLAQLLPNLRQRLSLPITEPYTALESVCGGSGFLSAGIRCAGGVPGPPIQS